MAELKRCNCGGMPAIVERFDTLQICCPNCGRATSLILGDYYDEAFMWAAYGDEATEEWNRMVDNG